MVDVTPAPAKRRRTSTVPTPEPGEISSEEGELTPSAERAHLDAQIAHDLQHGTSDVAQKDARYFMLPNVVCSHCGTKGHLSYDCPEEAAAARCFLCGATGHSSRDCPDDGCFHCGKTGHRARDCPHKGVRKRPVRRRVGPPRNITLDCYVCGKVGHLDCSVAKMPKGTLSCYNCGMAGHAGSGCVEPPAERVMPIVMEMDRERRAAGRGRKKRKKEDDDDDGEGDKLAAARDFRNKFLDKARQKRYNRGGG